MTEKDLEQAKKLNKKIKKVESIFDDLFKHSETPALKFKLYERTRDVNFLFDSEGISEEVPEFKPTLDLINNKVLRPLLLDALTETLKKLKTEFTEIGKYYVEEEDEEEIYNETKPLIKGKYS